MGDENSSKPLNYHSKAMEGIGRDLIGSIYRDFLDRFVSILIACVE